MLRRKREPPWRCTWPHVAVEDPARPLDGVAHPDARRLRPGPQLEVLGPVVVADAVAVVNRLPFDEVPAQELFGDEDVLEHVGALPGAWMSGGSDHHIAGLVPRAAALPVAVGIPRFGATRAGTGSRC
jgi:hypothetical protein